MIVREKNIQVCTKKQESRQSCRTNTIALCQCLCGVPYPVQGISNITYRLGSSTHFSNATGVICNRSKGVHSQNISATHQHTHRGNGCAEDSSRVNDMWYIRI